MRVIAVIDQREVIEKIFRHLGLWSGTPPLALARSRQRQTPGRRPASRLTTWTPCLPAGRRRQARLRKRPDRRTPPRAPGKTMPPAARRWNLLRGGHRQQLPGPKACPGGPSDRENRHRQFRLEKKPKTLPPRLQWLHSRPVPSPTEKQFSLNREASRKQFPISCRQPD